MKKNYNVVELFSGIGSQVRALKNIDIHYTVQATCEWDMHAFIAYDAIHSGTRNLPEVDSMSKDEILDVLRKYTISNNGKEAMPFSVLKTYSHEVLKRILSAIRRNNNLVNISEVNGVDMPDDTDIMTYSFPCQDLSNVGAFHGYNKGIDKNSGSRSSLLWEVGRILSEMQEAGKKLPRYLVMENVPTLLSERHFNNFKEWIGQLENLKYISKYIPVNARNYGIPQNRPRLLMISVYVGDNDSYKKAIQEFFDHLGDTEEVLIKEYRESKYYEKKTVKDLLRISYDINSKLWKEAVECTPNDTPSRRKIWDDNPVIVNEKGNITDDPFIRTITTKQDRNPNSGNIYFDCGIEGRGKFRYLTPRECLLFMGFEDKDYENIIANNPEQRVKSCLFPRDKIIRMAGNSIPLKMLEGFFFQFYKIEEIS
ncbi:MAG: DNA (cytosine-5-)-methyltransferase [Clostridia bacterium]|nr:DNA (cytosine-5-)-methyltransferase [Clostridia bacterium]